MAAAVERWRANRSALAELSIEPRELARRLELARARGRGDRRRAAPTRRGGRDPGPARRGAARRGDRARRGHARATRSSAEGSGARDVDSRSRSARSATWRGSTPRFEPLADRLAGLEAEARGRRDEVRAPRRNGRPRPRQLAALEERLGVDLRARAALRRRRGGGHRPRRAGAGRGGAAARPRGRAGAARGGGRHGCWPRLRRRPAGCPTPRRSAAADLATAVGGVLVELGFPAGVFEVALGRRPAGADEPAVELDGDAVAFDAAGADEVVFRLAPNPGEPPRPLAQIASGGELSRVALADQAGPRRGRRDPDARLRRGRHGHRRAQCRPGRPQPVGTRASPPGPVRHAPAADRRPRRCPVPDREARARRPHDHRGRTARSRGAHRRARPDARRAGGRGDDARLGARAARSGRERGANASARPAEAATGTPVVALADAIDDYLAYLRVERGLAPRTIRAYRADLDGLRGVPRRGARLGPLTGGGARLPRCPHAARSAPRSGPRADQPPPAGRAPSRASTASASARA